MKKINVLSLFDGISCARVAIERAGFSVGRYFASEIDSYAEKISQKNYPDIFPLGNVKNISGDKKQEKPKYIFVERNGVLTSHYTGGIDLLVGGSPCQDLSIAKKNRKGLSGDRSGLFWEYVRILKEVKPKYFILENVNSMSKESKDIITKELGVEPIMINAALVSAQNRKRLFWTNIKGITQPEDKNIFLKDILLDGKTHDLKSLCITASYHKKNERDFLKKRSGQMIRIGQIGNGGQGERVYSAEGKTIGLSAHSGGLGKSTGLYIIQKGRGRNPGGARALNGKTPVLTSSSWEHNNHLKDGAVLRKLHPIECERLQGLKDDYTGGVSNTQRYTCLGNAFNVDVITHILSFIKK